MRNRVKKDLSEGEVAIDRIGDGVKVKTFFLFSK
jgi:hypothetical protein